MRTDGPPTPPPPMLKNYLLVALRTLRRRRGYAVLNAVGLTVGLAAVAVVAAFLAHERAFDHHLPRADDLYRLTSNYRAGWYSTIGFPNFFDETEAGQRRLAEELRALPAVEEAAAVHLDARRRFVEADGRRFPEDRVLVTATGPAFVDLFGPRFIEGDAASALARPRTALLTEPTARRYFGDAAALGRTVTRDSVAYEVTGVIEAPPTTQHLRYDLVLAGRIPNWGAYTYLRLTPGTDPEAAAPLATDALLRVRPARADDPLHKGERLQPVPAIHLGEPTLYEAEPPGDPRYLRLFAAVALLLLVVTCTNYTNLAVALHDGRGREIGVRKAMGARREAVAGQFLTEAVLLATACVPPAVGLALLVLPGFNAVMGTEVAASALLQPGFLVLLTGVAVGVGLVSGGYPAFALSGHRAAELFRGSVDRRLSGARLRRALVGLQFALVIGLGSAAVLLHQQVRFMAEKDLGFEREGVVALDGVPDAEAFRRLRAELAGVPGVGALGTGPLPSSGFNRTTYRADTGDAVLDDANLVTADLGYFRAMGIESADLDRFAASGAGRAFFINETAARRLGYAEPVGRVVVTEPEWEREDGTFGTRETVAGVLPDWHLFPLRERVRPLLVVVVREPAWVWSAVARVETTNLEATMGRFEEAWTAAVPGRPFVPAFVDASLAELYEQERRASAFSTALTALAVLLAVLGLVGLAAFATAWRRKEVGIRKVLGARVGSLVGMLTREFVVLVGVALVAAAPVVLILVERWLDGFAYRIAVSPLVFAAVGAGVLGVTVLAVGWQALRAAVADPVDSLRHE